ncbi:MAG TPA: tripartite tricarboxylate transporter TctB family protein [Clostridia bacterium]|nr:tripartite tricarboxylate transporter TctB family protein [Clostridia bacterium]
MSEQEQKKRKLGIAELVTGCVLIAIALTIIYLTSNMRNVVDGIPGPRYMPLVYSGAMIALVLLYWLEAFLGNNLHTAKIPTLKELKTPMSFLLIGVLIVIFWEPLGAIVSVAIGAFAEMRFLQKFTWRQSIIMAIVLAVFTGVLFETVLGIPLPAGILKSILR